MTMDERKPLDWETWMASIREAEQQFKAVGDAASRAMWGWAYPLSLVPPRPRSPLLAPHRRRRHQG